MPSQERDHHRRRPAHARGAVDVYLMVRAPQFPQQCYRAVDTAFQVVGIEVSDRPAAHGQSMSRILALQASPVDAQGGEVRIGLEIQNRRDAWSAMETFDVDFIAWAGAHENPGLDRAEIYQRFCGLK